ncbi:unnamed protein product [Prunus armeniaca]
MSTQFPARVKVFRTDNEEEYVNNTLAYFFHAQGIIYQTTTLFTPQQNGASEEKNRQLLERKKGSKLKSLGLENLGLELHNDVLKDVTLKKKMTGRTGENDQLPESGAEDGALYELMTSRHLELDWSIEFGEDEITLCA